MTPLRARATRAGRVELEAGRRRSAMGPVGGGWYEAAEALAPGTDHLVLDGGPIRADPRSPRQPEGVHGPSRTLGVAAFPWTDGAGAGPPTSEAVAYEMHTETFTPEGTFDAAIAEAVETAGDRLRLPYDSVGICGP